MSILAYSQNNKHEIEVPFAVVEKPPIYPGCEKHTHISELKNCFSKQVSHFVNSRFYAKTNLDGKQRINVIFKVSKSGRVSDIKARASSKDLEKQAIAVIKNLPLMKPGYHKGKTVTVPFSLPIIFNATPTNNIRDKAAKFEIEHKLKSKRQAIKNKNSKNSLKKSKDTTQASLRRLFKLEKN